MTLILLRHGEKANILSDHAETYLSAKGCLQAISLVRQVELGLLPSPSHLLSSEVERTTETLQPLADRFLIQVLKKKEFDLQDYRESSSQFRVRVTRGLTYLTSFEDEAVVYACSHQDWLHEAMSLISTQEPSNHLNSWPTARYVIFKVPLRQLSGWQLIKEGQIV